MNNQELVKKFEEILTGENIFDIIEQATVFKKDYQKSDFYQKTKMPLADSLKTFKMYQLIDLDSLFNLLQKKINKLDLSNLKEILDEVNDVFNNENTEILNMLQGVKELAK